MTQALLQHVPGQLVHHNFFVIFRFDGQDHKKRSSILHKILICICNITFN